MDSSDDELLNNMANQWELTLANETNTFSENTTENNDDSDDLPSTNALTVLLKKFGHKKFRPLQWKIINSILKYKRDNCAVMTTGYGKSLCYQFPAVYSGGITLVISPLISLMEDQVLSLTVANIPSCLLGTAQKNTSQTVSDIFGNKFSVIYLTPEFCMGDYGASLLKDMNSKLKITLVAVDEAHCLSSWGHDFRLSYRKLGVLRDIFLNTPILAVTATATEKVKNDIVKTLKLNDPLMTCSGFDRPNLYLSVKPKGGSILSDLKTLMHRRDCIWEFYGSTIIYCISRKDTEDISDLLNHHNINCLPYHAGLTMNKRKEAHEQFVKDKISVIVATIAFGMGIDKPDIRNVIHYGCSGSIESYYQEIGRAGRDGLDSKCVTFYSPKDFNLHMFLFQKDSNSKRRADLFDRMKEYLLSNNCRRQFILSYFEGAPQKIPKRKVCCDNCAQTNTYSNTIYEGLDHKGMYDFTDDAVKYLSAVDAMHGTFGNGVYCLFLKGSKSAKIKESYRNHTCYGSGSSKSDEWWKAIGIFLELKKYLKQVRKNKGTFSYSVLDISDLGRKFLNSRTRKLVDQPTVDILNLLKKKHQQSGWISVDGNTGKADIAAPSTSVNSGATVALNEKETQEKMNDRLKIYRFLKNARSRLAESNEIMPYMIASDYILMELAKKKPSTLEEMKHLQIDGLTEAKLNKFGKEFLKVINTCTSPSNTETSRSKKSSILEILEEHPISHEKIGSSAFLTYDYFKSCMTVEDIAEKRKFTKRTVLGHLISLLKYGYPIKLEALGVTQKAKCIIMQVINNLGGHYSFLTPIKMNCPDDISYGQIEAVCAYLELRNHLKEIGIPYEEFDDYTFQEVSASNSSIQNVLETEFDDNDDLLSMICDKMEETVEQDEKQSILEDMLTTDPDFPPSKKIKTDTKLNSPPRESRTEIEYDITESVKQNAESSDDLLSMMCDKMEETVGQDEKQSIEKDGLSTDLDFPPANKHKIFDGKFNSPPRESGKEIENNKNESQNKITEPKKSATVARKKLPQWLSKKKVK